MQTVELTTLPLPYLCPTHLTFTSATNCMISWRKSQIAEFVIAPAIFTPSDIVTISDLFWGTPILTRWVSVQGRGVL